VGKQPLDRLRTDPGSRTFGELAQERQWALQEIHRLRALLAREDATRSHYVERSGKRDREVPSQPANQVIQLGRFLSLAEVTKRFGLSRSTMYKMQNEGRFPKSIRMGLRTVRWKYEDLMAWEDTLRR